MTVFCSLGDVSLDRSSECHGFLGLKFVDLHLLWLLGLHLVVLLDFDILEVEFPNYDVDDLIDIGVLIFSIGRFGFGVGRRLCSCCF